MIRLGLEGAKVGDAVMLTDVNWKGPQPSTISAIGRKYATIGRRKFELSTGIVADDYRHTRAFTMAQWARREVVAALDSAIRRVSTTPFNDALTNEKMQEVTRMLDDVAVKLGAKETK